MDPELPEENKELKLERILKEIDRLEVREPRLQVFLGEIDKYTTAFMEKVNSLFPVNDAGSRRAEIATQRLEEAVSWLINAVSSEARYREEMNAQYAKEIEARANGGNV